MATLGPFSIVVVVDSIFEIYPKGGDLWVENLRKSRLVIGQIPKILASYWLRHQDFGKSKKTLFQILVLHSWFCIGRTIIPTQKARLYLYSIYYIYIEKGPRVVILVLHKSKWRP